MLHVGPQHAALLNRETRREFVRIGGLSLLSSISLPRLLQARASGNAQHPARAKAVILLNLFGGPSHLDMFDPKPDAPAEVRGEFQPISTSLPNVQICEHLPQTAQWLHRSVLVRSVTHEYNSHNPYNVLTGFTGGNDRENYFAKRTDHPSMGSVCQFSGICRDDVPGYVVMPAHPGYSQALRRAGPYGGYLGSQFDPFITTCEPTFARAVDVDKDAYDPVEPVGEPRLPSFDALPEINGSRLDARRSLLAEVEARFSALSDSALQEGLTPFQRQAFSLLTSSRARQAFDLAQESEATRDRYGRSLYGSSLLLARRLVEAGVTFVAITTESKGGGHWDSHEKNFSMLRQFNLPNLDRIYTALVADLDERGLLDSTLVVVMGEMGRSPRINGKAGRDHWPQCGFALFTGGGMKQGLVHGASDRQGAWPVDQPVTPGDIVATIYHLLGVDYRLHVLDLSGRPIHVAHGGEPIWNVLA